jgi:hypothetical protein
MTEITRSKIVEVAANVGKLSDQDIIDVLCRVDPVAWTEHRRVLKGMPFSFNLREYLYEPYRDNYPDLFFMKGRQVEMSEFSMNWLMRKLDAHEYTAGLHAFPRALQAEKFSKQRVEFAISDSDYLKNWHDSRNSGIMVRRFIKDKNEKGLAPYNFYMLGGTWESRKDTVGDASRGTSLDFIVYDERQDHPNDVETVLGEGASHSEFKHTLTLGTPKMPGIQFDQQWNASDKRMWYVKCRNCGREFPITMENILPIDGDDIAYYYGCAYCKANLERNIGRWVITNPQRKPEYHGYHINQLMVPWITATDIIGKRDSVKYPKRRFYNEVLGESYGGDDIPITLSMLEACTDNHYKLGDTVQGENLYVGIDWGAAESYMVMENKNHRIVDLMIARDSDPRKHSSKMARYISKYGKAVKRVVCDAGPDITRFHTLKDALADENVTRNVFACYYTSPPAKSDITYDDNKHIVSAGRSEAIEKLIDEIHELKMIIPGVDKNIERVDILIDQMCNIAGEKNENISGNSYVQYIATGPDHFLHAKIYADIACGNQDINPIGAVAPHIINEREKTKIGMEFSQIPRKADYTLFPQFHTQRSSRLNRSRSR